MNTITVPSTPPTAAPTTPLFPGREIRMNADFKFGLGSVPGKGQQPVAYLWLRFNDWTPGTANNLTQQECQDLVNTFWSGTGPDYYAEASYRAETCEIEAYYTGEARHAFYSLDESGHMQVRPPMAYLNQIATSFETVSFGRLEVNATGLINAHCNASPTKEDLDQPLAVSHFSTCQWISDKGATIPTTDDPLVEGDAEDSFLTRDAGTVGPFTELNLPVNPFTITPAPTTDPATGAASSAAASGDQSETSEHSSTGLLIGIGAAIAALLLVGTGALVVALRRKK
ncbi:hypothetical protein [Actinomyces sp.]